MGPRHGVGDGVGDGNGDGDGIPVDAADCPKADCALKALAVAAAPLLSFAPVPKTL